MFKEVPDDLWQRIAPLLLPFQRKHSGRGSAAHRLRGRFRRCVDNTACLSASPCVRIPSLTDSTALGKPALSQRQILNGILYVLTTGCQAEGFAAR